MLCCSRRDRVTSFWSVVTPDKSVAEIEAERWVFVVPYGVDKYCLPLCTVPFRRWMLFLAAFVAQFCNGSLYAWSILNDPIDGYIQTGDQNTTQTVDQHAVVTFYVACGCMGFACALFGPHVERQGPRASLLLGTFIFFIGNVISYVSVHFKLYAGLYVGYGLFCGVGFGINYIAPVSALQKWFPDLRGTAGGFAVCGFGLGATLWSNIYEPLMDAIGIDKLFLVVGSIISVTLLLTSFVLRTPPPDFVVRGRDVHGVKVASTMVPKAREDFDNHIPGDSGAITERVSTVLGDVQVVNYFKVFDYQEEELGEAEILYHNKIKNLQIRECVFSVDFAFLYLAFLTAVATGLIFMSRVVSLGKNVYNRQDDDAMTRLVMFIAICNFMGRLLCPIVSDGVIRLLQINPAFGRKLTMSTLMVVQIVLLVWLPKIIQDETTFDTFQCLVCILTFCYGGVMGTIPSFLTDMYGVYNTGTMHGIILTCWALCAVAGGLTFQYFFYHVKDDHEGEGRLAEIAAYTFNFHWLLILVCIGCVLIPFVRTNPVDRFFPGYQISFWGRPIVRWIRDDY
ncbi:hypothetical protein LEN26_020398 [Aphanomyces euteiches]|nr:hypothetical protein LEN26_020398 [Aphanomyces euteiches]